MKGFLKEERNTTKEEVKKIKKEDINLKKYKTLFKRKVFKNDKQLQYAFGVLNTKE